MTSGNGQGVAPTLLDRIAVVAQTIVDKKGEAPVALEVGQVLAITDAFVIASAPNTRLVRTLVEEIEKQLKVAGHGGPVRVEGLREASWVLMDYGDLVVHIFLTETREFYDLERLWSDAPRVPLGVDDDGERRSAQA
jgi:ribosome-associated protein